MKITKKSFLAPIADYTNSCFRIMCRNHKANFAVVPLVSSIAICNSPKEIDIDLDSSEKNTGLQIFGNDPKKMALSISKLNKKYDNITWFDINLGCPAIAITGSGAGSALLKDPEKIEAIIKECKKQDVVLSAKTRILDDEDKTIALCKKMEDAGLDFLTVHARTPKQGYSGTADWEMIKKIKEELTIPIVGNGDIKLASEGLEKVKNGYCDSFMIARAAMANPYAFENKESEQTLDCKIKLFTEYKTICKERQKLEINDLRMKALNFFHGFESSAKIRASLSSAKSIEEIEKIIGA